MRQLRLMLLVVLVCLALVPGTARAQGVIIDHNCADVSAIPQSWTGVVKLQKLHYAHTSHGSQLISGTANLELQHVEYGIAVNQSTIPGLPPQEDPPVLRVYDGTIIDTYATPDTYWESPNGIVSTKAIANTGDFDFSMWAWCGQVSYYSAAQVQTYLDTMNQFEGTYPDMRFIYMTGHLDGTGSSGTLHQNNEIIRSYCRENNKVLFDFADIERFDPDGVDYLDRSADDGCYYDGGNWAQEWCAAHPGFELCGECECEHSEALNCNRKARAFWWMMARLVGWEGPEAPTLIGLEIQGPALVDEESSTAYTAMATWSDASTSDVTGDCTWSENSPYASVTQGGLLIAYSLDADQVLTLSASYASGGTTLSDSQPVSIRNTNPAGETATYSGWWWEGDTRTGTGISIEQQGDRLYLAWYVYDDAGLPVWYSALMDGGPATFAGTLYRYEGWPLADNNPLAGYAGTVNGDVSLTFDSFGEGTLTYDDGGRTEYVKKINRFMSGDVDIRDIQGWWWDTDYQGMGVFVESRGGQLFAAWYHYRDDTSPRWWISIDDFDSSDASYAGEMYEYSGGQTLTGDYAVPTFEPSPGTASIEFSGDTATLSWGNYSYNLERFRFNE